MLRRRTAILVVTGMFFAALLLSLLTHSTGVVRNDPARNIWIPAELTMPLQLQVAFNDTQIFFRYRWPAKEPHVLTDLLRYSDGKWQRQLRTPIGSDPDGIAEDRLSMMLDDGSVPEFQRYGGYITVGANMRDFTGSGADAAHRRKYLPATRKDPNDWYSIADQATLDAQRRAGYFLDLWHWRAHLSNPLGRSDDQHIAWYRLYDSGETLFFSNWDADSGQPRWMFDPERGGVRALRWEDVPAARADAKQHYYLREDAAVPFDPDHEWREGDVIPGQVLREAERLSRRHPRAWARPLGGRLLGRDAGSCARHGPSARGQGAARPGRLQRRTVGASRCARQPLALRLPAAAGGARAARPTWWRPASPGMRRTGRTSRPGK